MTFQWAGSLSGLQAALRPMGWRPPEAWSISGTLGWLAPSADPMALPVLPYLDRGELPKLTLIHSGGDGDSAPSRLVLRIWPSDVELHDGHSSPLWLGSVVEERLDSQLHLFTTASVEPEMDGPRDRLAASVKGSRLASRPGADRSIGWDSRVLLAREQKSF